MTAHDEERDSIQSQLTMLAKPESKLQGEPKKTQETVNNHQIEEKKQEMKPKTSGVVMAT